MSKKTLILYSSLILALFVLLANLQFWGILISLISIILISSNTNKETIGIGLILFFLTPIGYLGSQIGIPFIGGKLVMFIAILLLNKSFFKILQNKSTYTVGILYILLVSIPFILGFLRTNHPNYALEKLVAILFDAPIYFIVLIILFKSKRIDFLQLSILALFSNVLYMSVIYTYNSNISNLFAYGVYRQGRIIDLGYTYQDIGVKALISISILLGISKAIHMKISKSIYFLILFINTIMIYQSGARQALVGLFLILLIRSFYFSNIKRFIYSTLIMTIAAIFLLKLAIETNSDLILKSITNTNDEFGTIVNRTAEFLYSTELMKTNLFSGIGLGNFTDGYLKYHPWLKQWEQAHWYPHNIFLEIINELGLISLIFIFVITITKINLKDILFQKSINSEFYTFFLFIPLFIRANVSGDIVLNFIIFSFLATTITLKRTLYENCDLY